MPIYDSALDYIFTDETMLEHGWDGVSQGIREKAKNELASLKAERDKLRKDYDNLIGMLVETYSL